jgi:hypothetical protein
MAKNRKYLRPYIECKRVVPTFPPSGDWDVASRRSTIAMTLTRDQASQLSERLQAAVREGPWEVEITCTRSSKVIKVSIERKAQSPSRNSSG